MARRLLGSKAGESLVELAVSIAVLSLIVLWAMSAFGAYAKTGQDLDSVGQAMSLADSTMETLKTYSLTDFNGTLPACPSTNFQYVYAVVKTGPTNSLTLIEVTIDVLDKATPPNNVYVVMTSFLRDEGGLNVGARKRRGTTLVELSLVIAILAMVALPFAAFVSQNLKTTVQSSTQLKEQMVLEQVMQDMEKHMRSAVRTPSLMNPTPNEIVFYSVVPEAVASNLPKQTQYKYSLADGLLTKSVDTASATFPDGLEAGMITSMTFPEGNLDPTNPPCYITVLLEAGTTAPEKTVLRKTIYLRNYTSTVSIVKILGVTVPRTGDFPVTTITPTTQYTGIVAWTPALPVGEKFKNATEYTATITVAPIGGYTLTGVAANFFTVAGASVAVPNDINAGIVITGEFPMTGEIGATPLAITLPTLTLSKPYDGNTTAVVTAGTLIGVVSPDIVTVTAVATYDTAAVGMGKTITVVYSLAGADAAKYVKPVDYTVTTGVITAEAITVTATGPTKVYGTALTAGTSTTNFTA